MKHFGLISVCWAAVGLAVIDGKAKNVIEDELPLSEPHAGGHGRHHYIRRTSWHTPQMVPRAVQHQIEQMAMRADRLATKDSVAAAKVQSELETMEAALATRVDDDAALADEISAVRAELCAKKGFLSHQSEECEAFMSRACYSSSQQANEADLADSAAAPVGLVPRVPIALCQRYWGKQAIHFAAAPAPAIASAPAPMPASAEDYGEGLPEQGFHGDLVEHVDQDTQTSDWQREFGPHAGHRTYREICKEHPENQWCRVHLQHRGKLPPGWERQSRPEQSSTVARSGHPVFVAVATSLAVFLGVFVV
mmetsp:Transcript_34960/g.88042  ORF Transcript_34960/g.88042 Transcript_34960/m.88042 type:complete len:308 (-) Transcript_34960:62-985(-)